MIASHYAEPLERRLVADAILRSEANEQGEAITRLKSGDILAVLDSTGGWAWGYAGADRRVGYVRAESVVAD